MATLNTLQFDSSTRILYLTTLLTRRNTALFALFSLEQNCVDLLARVVLLVGEARSQALTHVLVSGEGALACVLCCEPQLLATAICRIATSICGLLQFNPETGSSLVRGCCTRLHTT